MSTPRRSRGRAAPSPAQLRFALLVIPVLVLASAAASVAYLSFGDDTFQNCRYLGPSTRMVAAAWGGPLLSVAAGLRYLAWKCEAARTMLPDLEPWVWTTARISLIFVPLLTLVQIVLLFWLYDSPPDVGHGCSGLGG